MNAPRSFIRATMAPASLAAAIGLAFAVSAPAQAQYTYPGTASSSGHYASSIHPIRAGARERAEYGALPGRPTPAEPGEPGTTGHGSHSVHNGGAQYRDPSRFDGAHVRDTQVARPMPAHRPQRATATMNGGYGNPSMQRGEACPPGSNCGVPASGRQQSNGGGPASSAGYGGQERYGYGGRAAESVHPAQVGGSASISPVRAGAAHGALNYGTSQNAAGYRNTVTGNSSGPSTHVSGQENSFTGPNGKQVNMGNQTSFTGPNGQKQTIGGGPDLNNLGGGSGHQKGSDIKQGMSYSADGNGSISGTRTGSAPGMASANGLDMNNGGAAGTSEGTDGGSHKLTNYNDTHNPDGSSKSGSGNSSSGSFWSHPIDNTVGAVEGVFKGGSGSHDGNSGNSHSSTGKGSGSTGAEGMDPNKMYPVKNPNSHHVQSGGGDMPADMGATAGPGEIVSGTGQVVRPGQKKGQDTGGGQTDDGSSHGGGQNAQGQYIAPSGQDAPVKPKEVGVLKMNYNGKNGVTDPKLNGTNGGGG
jgi:hypothetical protein